MSRECEADAPKTGETQSVESEDNCFQAAIDEVEARAIRLFRREARLGGSSYITGKARMTCEEVNERLERLAQHFDVVSRRVAELQRLVKMLDAADLRTENKESIAARIDLLSTEIMMVLSDSSSFQGFPPRARIYSRDDGKLSDRLYRLWDELENLKLGVQSISQQAADQGDDDFTKVAHLLTPEELEGALADDGTSQDEAVEPLFPASFWCELNGIEESLLAADAEVRRVIAGRFGSSAARGRPEKLRTQKIAMELLGVANYFLIPLRRNTEPSPETTPTSCADAVIAAFDRLRTLPDLDPFAQTLLREMPPSYDALVKVIDASRRDDARGRALSSRLAYGKRHTEQRLRKP